MPSKTEFCGLVVVQIASARLTNALDTTARPLSYSPLADYVLSTTVAGEACSVQLKGELELGWSANFSSIATSFVGFLLAPTVGPIRKRSPLKSQNYSARLTFSRRVHLNLPVI